MPDHGNHIPHLLPDALLRVVLAAVDQSTDGIIVTTPEIDLPGPQIIYANPAFSRITGYSPNEVLGQTPRILQGPKSDRAVLDRVRATLERQQPFFGEIINYRKDGTEFWMEWHIAPVMDERGKLRNWIAIQRDVTGQRQLQTDLSLANVRLQQEVAERRKAEASLQGNHALLEQLVRIQEAERQMMAYEIHDGILQYATGAHLYLDAFLTQNAELADVDEVEAAMIQLKRIIREGRQLMNHLRPPLLDELGVVRAIEQLLKDEETAGLVFHFTAPAGFPRLLSSEENAIYRIVQEAITNARKHSGADRLEIRLHHDTSAIHLEVEDWGRGFDPNAVRIGAHGLQGIRERVKLLGGTVSFQAALGEGSLIVATLPRLDPLAKP